VDPDPWIKRFAVLACPGHVPFDRSDRVAILHARTDRSDQGREAGVAGEAGHPVENPIGQAAALKAGPDLGRQRAQRVRPLPGRMGVEGGDDHGIDSVAQSLGGSVPAAGRRVALSHDFLLAVVVEDELEIREHIEQAPPVPVHHVAMPVVLRPHLLGGRRRLRPQLRTL
jgi:hypothetical protein